MNNNYLFDNSLKSFKERRLLKIKLKKIANKCIKPNCDKYLMKMRDLKIDELNNSNFINNIIKQSINFHFGNYNSNPINNNINQIKKSIKSNLSEFDINCNTLSKTLKKELSLNELQAIKNDKLYYISDQKIRNNINILKEKSLTKRINEEENEKNKLYILNDKLKKIKFRNKFNNSFYNIENRIKQINSQIKHGILNIKKEENKNNYIKEKRKNIVNIFKKKATKEINNLLMNDSLFNNKIFNINPKNKKDLIEEYTNYSSNKIKNNFSKNLNKSTQNLEADSGRLRYRNKLKKIPLFYSQNSQQKNRGKYYKSKSLDAIEKENENSINNLNKIQLKKNSLKHSYLSSSNSKYIDTKNEKIKDNKTFDENSEKIALILLTNKIKNIYKNKESKNLQINNKTLSKIYHVYKL